MKTAEILKNNLDKALRDALPVLTLWEVFSICAEAFREHSEEVPDAAHWIVAADAFDLQADNYQH
jgi:hypothetical protein